VRATGLFSRTAFFVAAVAVLSGCSATPPQTGAEVVPVAGDCWTSTFSAVSTGATWRGDVPVDCTKPHESYTYAVVELTAKYPDTWQTTGATPSLAPDIQSAAGGACVAKLKTFVPAITTDDVLIYPSFYVASLVAWKAGSRWVRCDIAELAIGSPAGAPALAALPTDIKTLTSAITSDPKKFALCLDSPGSTVATGPLRPGHATFADCTAAPQWTRTLELTMPDAVGSTYPTVKEFDAFGSAKCGVDVNAKKIGLFVTYPSPTSWPQGDRGFSCWTTAY
jgi:hypothetical protein